jgi:hypothetical protein
MKYVKLIIFIVIIVFLIASAFYVYYFYDKPKQENAQKSVNIYISASEESIPDRKIEINYSITGLNFYYKKNGTTLKSSLILETLPYNNTYKILAIPGYGQEFYYYSYSFDTKNENNKQVKLLMKRPADLSIEKSGNFITNDNLSILIKYNDISNDREYRNPYYCVDLGFHILSFETNHKKVEKPNEFKNYDKCFSLGNSINTNNREKNISINYSLWGDLDSSDYIKVTIFDTDLVDGKLLVSKDTGDLGGKNYDVIFK